VEVFKHALSTRPVSPYLSARGLWLFLLGLVASAALPGRTAGFEFREVSPQSLGLFENGRPVFVYNHGVLTNAAAPTDRARSTYVHPLYGLDGEVLTDDFPKDHYHHRGLFWAWPHVKVGERHYDLWMYPGGTNIQQRFERWLERSAATDRAILAVKNGWYVGNRKVMEEEARFSVLPATDDGRAMDVRFKWRATTEPVTLSGAEGKSYGGLTMRYAPGTNTVIAIPAGRTSEDLYMTNLPWTSLSRQWPDGRVSGAALFVAPDHPDFPPQWLTRHYGVLCLGWPGITPKTLAPGETWEAAYRVFTFRGEADTAQLNRAYDAYTREIARSESQPAPPSLPVRAEVAPDRFRIFAGDQLFTEYFWSDATKYPYFFPVNGPASGRSVTTHRTEPYPHHSSLFFGCDRVNGGNFWQEGLERGRIVPLESKLVEANGQRVVIEQTCRWQRLAAEAPFEDRRRITVTAPSASRRVIDFDVKLTALTDVKIEKTNHSLFAARMAPDLAVAGGGTLINAAGDSGEKATLSKPSDWMDARGPRGEATEGLAIFSHPKNRWSPSPWFTRDYGFFSPTPLNWLEDGVRLAKGDTLRLLYRVVVHSDGPTREQLQAEFERWAVE
jgi:hypothetical protein